MNKDRYLYIFAFVLLTGFCVVAQNRTFDGSGNNLTHPEYGASHTPIKILTSLIYNDSVNLPNAANRPNPRDISNELFAQGSELIYSKKNLSDFVWVFGQFIDHDITFISNSESETAFINVPPCDPNFDPMCTGTAIIPMMRSKAIAGTGTSKENPRKVANEISAWIDGSGVYGSDLDRANWLRTFEDGKLKTSEDNILPFNTDDGNIDGRLDPDAPEMDNMDAGYRRWYVAGDVRANENVLLTAMHVLFVREHNRTCDILKEKYPTYSDEELYQKARKIVGGIIQEITFSEWLPAMGITLEQYKGYKDDIDPSITNEFSTAAFRFGHTLLSPNILRMDKRCEKIPQGNLTLRDAFFNPLYMITGGIESLYKGMASNIQQELDCKVIDDVRNFLFGPPGSGFGLDLVSININRGRERGLPDYNALRENLGLGKVRSFSEINSDPEVASILQTIYGNVDNIDPWVGFLAEEHLPGAMFGESIMVIVKEQFNTLRDGDRFYYLNDDGLTIEEKEMIQGTRMTDLVMRNTALEQMQNNVFVMSMECESFDLEANHLQVTAYPNPFIGNFDLAVYSYEEGEADVIVTDQMGKIVNKIVINLERGVNAFEMKMPLDLLPGLYVLQIYKDNNFNSFKIIRSR